MNPRFVTIFAAFKLGLSPRFYRRFLRLIRGIGKQVTRLGVTVKGFHSSYQGSMNERKYKERRYRWYLRVLGSTEALRYQLRQWDNSHFVYCLWLRRMDKELPYEAHM